MAGRGLPGLMASAGLALGSLGLIAAGAQFMTADPVELNASVAARPMAMPEIPAAMDLPLMSAEATRRPVFHRDRTPIDDPGTPAMPTFEAASLVKEETTAAASNLKLKGVIIDGVRARAAVLPPGTSEPVWVSAGETVQGWTVESVSADVVKLSSGEEIAELRMVEDKKKANGTSHVE